MKFQTCSILLFAALAFGEEPVRLDVDVKIPQPGALQLDKKSFKVGATITAIAWSPDGSKLAVCTGDRTVGIWSATTEELLSSWQDDSLKMKSIAWSSDGELVAVGGEDKAVAWKVAGQARVQEVVHEGGDLRIAFIPSTHKLVTAVNGGDLKISECDGSGTARSLKLPMAVVNAIAVSGDGKRVAVAGVLPQLAVLSLESGEILATRRDVEHRAATWVSWSRDDSEILVDYPQIGMQFVKPTKSASDDRTRHLRCDGTDIIASPRGDQLASVDAKGSVDGLVLGDGRNWTISLPEVDSRPMAFSPQGQFLAVAWTSETLAIVDARTGEALLGPTWRMPRRVAWSPDGKTIYATRDRSEVHSFEAATGRHLDGWVAPGNRFVGLAIRKDGAILVASTNGAFIHVRDLATSRDFVREPCSGTPVFSGLSEDGSTFAWTQDKSLHARDLYSGEALPDIALLDEPTRLFMALNAHGDVFLQGQANADREKVVYTDLYAGLSVLEGKVPAEWWPKSAVLSSDGSLTAFVGAFSPISVCATGRTYPISCDAAIGWDKCLAFSPDGRFLAAAGDGGVIFDPRSGRQIAVLKPVTIEALAWSPDGKRLAGIDDKGVTRIWNVTVKGATSDPSRDALSDWGDMVCQRTDRSFQAMSRLEAGGNETVALLKEKLAEKENAGHIESLLDQLTSENFDERKAARDELTWLGVQAEPAIVRRIAVLERGSAPRNELEALLRAAECRVSSSQQNLRRQRAMQVLEGIGSAESLEALRDLSKNSPSPRERADAEEAVHRLESKRAR